jgi:hypothetical protein
MRTLHTPTATITVGHIPAAPTQDTPSEPCTGPRRACATWGLDELRAAGVCPCTPDAERWWTP